MSLTTHSIETKSNSSTSLTLLQDIRLFAQRYLVGYIESHNGQLEIHSVENGVVTISMTGTCTNCSAANVTIKALIERSLRKEFRDIQRVVRIE